MHNLKMNNELINPFAFSSETNLRFFLLFLFMLFAVLVNDKEYINPLNQEEKNYSFYFTYLDNKEFELESMLHPTLIGESYLTEKQISDVTDLILIQMDRFKTSIIVFWLGFRWAIPFIGFASIIYFVYPYYQIRKRRIKKIDSDLDPLLISKLKEMSRLIGVVDLPLIGASNDKQIGGHTFIYKNKYFIRLGGQMRLLMRVNLEKFQTILLHELSHIVNRDVKISMAIDAVFKVFCLYLIWPLFLIIRTSFLRESYFNGKGSIFLFFHQVASWLFITAIGIYYFCSVFRQKELFADWRLLPLGYKPKLLAIFKNFKSKKKLWRDKLKIKLHPTLETRIQFIDEPIRFYKLPIEIILLTGVIVGMILFFFDSISYPFKNLTLSIWKSFFYGYIGTKFIFSQILTSENILLLEVMNVLGVGIYEFSVYSLYLLPTLVVSLCLLPLIKRSVIGGMIDKTCKSKQLIDDIKFAVIFGFATQFGLELPANNSFTAILFVMEASGGTFLVQFFVGALLFSISYFIWFFEIRLLTKDLIGRSYNTGYPKTNSIVITLISIALLFPSLAFIINFQGFFCELLSGVGTLSQIESILPWYNPQNNIKVMLINFSITIFVLFLVSITTILIVLIKRIYSSHHVIACPSCKTKLARKLEVDDCCPSCGSPLNIWLFI